VPQGYLCVKVGGFAVGGVRDGLARGADAATTCRDISSTKAQILYCDVRRHGIYCIYLRKSTNVVTATL
jgi:hypothetical protein